MSFIPVDCHAHTTMSDGALTPAELVATAAARGVRPSIADHLSRDVSAGIGSVEGVRDYLDELDRHPVLRGGEFCWHDALWRELPGDLVARFTHRVGSLHAIFLPSGERVHMFQRRFPAALSPDDYIEPVIRDLHRCGILREGDKILWKGTKLLPYTNIIFDLERAEAVKTVHGFLDEVGISYCGRYGDWGYMWTDESFISGERAAERSLTQLKASA